MSTASVNSRPSGPSGGDQRIRTPSGVRTSDDPRLWHLPGRSPAGRTGGGGTFSLGFSGQQGDSETTDITVALDADYEDETRRWNFDARYNFSASEGSTTENNAMIGLDRDFLFAGSRWFAFARGRFDYDDFRIWQFRLQGAGGVGYEFVKSETFELRGRLGPSVVQEWSENPFRAEGLVGPELVWRLTPNQRILASNFFYYAFTPWVSSRT